MGVDLITNLLLKDMCLPAGVYWKIFGVVGVLLILLKVQLCQQLTGFHHGVISIL